MARNLAAGGVPDGKELSEQGRWSGDTAVVATELKEEEDEDATQEADG